MKKMAVTQVDKNEFFSDEKELIKVDGGGWFLKETPVSNDSTSKSEE